MKRTHTYAAVGALVLLYCFAVYAGWSLVSVARIWDHVGPATASMAMNLSIVFTVSVAGIGLIHALLAHRSSD